MKERAWRKLCFHAIAIISLVSTQTVVRAQESAPATKPDVSIQTPTQQVGGMTILTPTGGVDIRPYLEKMHGEVQKSWTAALPQAFYREEFGEAVEAVIKFRINRDGTIQNVSLEVSSGNDSLDQAALSGIRAASPVDALPQTFQGPWIEIRAPFQYKHAASRYKCPPPTGQTIGAPPFDRLELLAFLEGKNPADYEARVVCERGINFTPDYPLLTALRTSGAPR